MKNQRKDVLFVKSYFVHLIRHGITKGNLEGRYIGSTDLPLCPEGEAQIRSYIKKYNYPEADLYFSSPLLRCKQTLHLIYPDAGYRIVPGLAEHRFGEFEGKSMEQLKDNEEFKKWMKEGTAPEGTESNLDFAKRVCKAFNETVKTLLSSGQRSAVICTHGGVIMTLLTVYGFPKKEMVDWMCDSGMGYTIRITPTLWMRDGTFEVESIIPEGVAEDPDFFPDAEKDK